MANSSINLQPLLFESDEGGVGGREGEVGGRKENRGWGEGVDQRKTVGQRTAKLISGSIFKAV